MENNILRISIEEYFFEWEFVVRADCPSAYTLSEIGTGDKTFLHLTNLT